MEAGADSVVECDSGSGTNVPFSCRNRDYLA